jgi:hypothetical protein
MTIEVFNNQKMTIGFVVAKNILSGMDTVRKAFPNVGSVDTQSFLPSHDKRLTKIAENIYSWDLTG